MKYNQEKREDSYEIIPLYNEAGLLERNWILDNLLEHLAEKDMDLALLFSSDQAIESSVDGSFVNYTLESLLTAFKVVMKTKNISQGHLARRMGVEPTYISSFFHRRYTRSIQVYTIDRICRALDVSVIEVLSIAKAFL